MKITRTDFEGLSVIELDKYEDSRGFFVERFNSEKFSSLGLPTEFVQDNHSRSFPGVLRGLHYQHVPPQGKLVGVINGRIWDVAVDVRKNSRTFGKYFGLELSGDNGKLLWMPAGFAHGFCVLGNQPADVVYKVNANYNSKGENGIVWNDKTLDIKWPLNEMSFSGEPIISPRDKSLPEFSTYMSDMPEWEKEFCPA